VRFFKGDFRDFVAQELAEELLKTLNNLTGQINWGYHYPRIFKFIRFGLKDDYDFLVGLCSSNCFVEFNLTDFRTAYKKGDYFKSQHWARVCITSLFTFYAKQTIEAIEFAKRLVPNDRIMVGGILATVKPDYIFEKTGITPYEGLLLTRRLFPGDSLSNQIIDSEVLDYSILEDIDYRYPVEGSYYGSTTKGCPNDCAFCVVPTLEPRYKNYCAIGLQINRVRKLYGEQHHLLLMDNNVFASNKFDQIIDTIKRAGFADGSTYLPTNPIHLLLDQLKNNLNDRAYIKKAASVLQKFRDSLFDETFTNIKELLVKHSLDGDFHAANKHNVLDCLLAVQPIFDKKWKPVKRVRFVDFNQGLDAYLATPHVMKRLSEISIRPLRVAFDNWNERGDYVKALCLAKCNKITQMSNYLLYNFLDKPIDLYNRLLLNIDLCDALKINVYSFPMKYHPIREEEWFDNRNYLGKHWSRKSIRTIQAVLNSTKGKIGRGRTFFFAAFGRSKEEFYELLQMPEAFIINRWDAELNGYTQKWRDAYSALSKEELIVVNKIVEKYDFDETHWGRYSPAIKKVLRFHLHDREKVKKASAKAKEKWIEEFGKTCPTEVSAECAHLIKLAQHS